VKFYSTGPWGLCYKTLLVRNLLENDKFHSKIVYSSLDKKTLAYYEVRKLLIRNVFIVRAPGPGWGDSWTQWSVLEQN
jgi:hypothetical protein